MRSALGWVVAAVMMTAGLMAAPSNAQMFQTVAPGEAQLLQDGPGKLYCPNCGMNLVKFYKTSHAVETAGEPAGQYCSLHCLVDVYAEIPPGVLVADAETRVLIPADTAHYVVGADIKGTMTMTSKYAFGERQAAETFVAEHGGKIMTFAEAVDVARQGLAAENEMIDGKRTTIAEKGRKIFEKMCAAGELPEFSSIFNAKTWLAEHETCGPLKDNQLQALAIYLVRRGATGVEVSEAGPIRVPAKAKCPVCGMFVAKYPKWAAVIRTADGREFFFDGVKDLIKFNFDPALFRVDLAPDDRAEILVTDYYSLKAIDARTAWYVVGSNVYGPMGNELVPFVDEKDAGVFLKDHAGERILTFDEITGDLIRGLDR